MAFAVTAGGYSVEDLDWLRDELGIAPSGTRPVGKPDRVARQKAADTPITVEVDMGSASSRGRPPQRSWLVRIRRSNRTVIVAIGLHRHAAHRLAQDLTEILTNTPETQRAAID